MLCTRAATLHKIYKVQKNLLSYQAGISKIRQVTTGCVIFIQMIFVGQVAILVQSFQSGELIELCIHTVSASYLLSIVLVMLLISRLFYIFIGLTLSEDMIIVTNLELGKDYLMESQLFHLTQGF